MKTRERLQVVYPIRSYTLASSPFIPLEPLDALAYLGNLFVVPSWCQLPTRGLSSCCTCYMLAQGSPHTLSVISYGPCVHDWFQGMEWPEPGNIEELKNYYLLNLYDWCTNPLMVLRKLISRSHLIFSGRGRRPIWHLPLQSQVKAMAEPTQQSLKSSQVKLQELCKDYASILWNVY